MGQYFFRYIHTYAVPCEPGHVLRLNRYVTTHSSSRYSRAPRLPGTHLDEEQRRGLVDRRTQLNHVYTKRGPAQGSCYMLRPLHDSLLRYAQLTGCIACTRDRDSSSGSTATDWCYSVPDRGKAAGTALGPTHAQ